MQRRPDFQHALPARHLLLHIPQPAVHPQRKPILKRNRNSHHDYDSQVYRVGRQALGGSFDFKKPNFNPPQFTRQAGFPEHLHLL